MASKSSIPNLTSMTHRSRMSKQKSRMNSQLRMPNTMNSDCCNGCQKVQCGNVRVPAIDITAQTLIGGSDMGDAKFTIYDEYQYYEKCKLSDSKCQVIYVDKDAVKKTIFRKNCLYTVSVLKDDGKTAQEKSKIFFSSMRVKSGLTLLISLKILCCM